MKLKKMTKFKNQQGAVALFVTIIMLLLISLVTILTSKAVITERHIAANLHREKSAYENAEAGLQFAKNYLRRGYDHNSDGVPDTDIMSGIAVDASLPIPTVDLSAGSLGLAPSGGHIVITSTGLSDDSLGKRSVYEERLVAGVTGGKAPYPLIAHTNVGLSGSAGAIVNAESNATIWAGGNAGITGNGSTFITDGAGGIQEVSDKSSMGVDIINNDFRLASLSNDEFFSNFFNGSKDLIHSQAVELLPGEEAKLKDPAFNNNQTIWINGDTTLESNTIVGCSLGSYPGSSKECRAAGGTIEPVILIVDGDLDSRGTVDIYGILYVTGNWVANGTFNVYGSVIVENGANISGNLNITYDSDVLGNGLGGFVATKVPNSWRDF